MREGKIDWLWPWLDLEKPLQFVKPGMFDQPKTDQIADAMHRLLQEQEAERDGKGV